MLAMGLVPVGKSSLPEFGLTATTEPLLTGPTHNPWALGHSTGGSSGGSRAGRGRSGTDRLRQRRRRIDPHPSRLHRPGRIQAQS